VTHRSQGRLPRGDRTRLRLPAPSDRIEQHGIVTTVLVTMDGSCARSWRVPGGQSTATTTAGGFVRAAGSGTTAPPRTSGYRGSQQRRSSSRLTDRRPSSRLHSSRCRPSASDRENRSRPSPSDSPGRSVPRSVLERYRDVRPTVRPRGKRRYGVARIVQYSGRCARMTSASCCSSSAMSSVRSSAVMIPTSSSPSQTGTRRIPWSAIRFVAW